MYSKFILMDNPQKKNELIERDKVALNRGLPYFFKYFSFSVGACIELGLEDKFGNDYRPKYRVDNIIKYLADEGFVKPVKSRYELWHPFQRVRLTSKGRRLKKCGSLEVYLASENDNHS